MRINISVDIQSQDEIALASELLNTLRQLTDHITVTGPNDAPTDSNSMTPSGGLQESQTPPTPAPSAADAPSTLAPAGADVAAAGAMSAPSTAPAASGPVPEAVPTTGAAAVPAPTPQPAAVTPSADANAGASDMKTLFREQILQLENPAGCDIDALAQVIVQLLHIQQPGQTQTSKEAFLEAFYEQVLSEELATQGHDFNAYFNLLKAVPTAEKIKPPIVTHILNALKVDRTMEDALANRIKFFPHAEAFAQLINIGFVAQAGAFQVMVKLISKPSTRVAGVTMLTKTIHKCYPMLSQLDAKTKADLLGALVHVQNEPLLTHDYNYIYENLVPHLQT